ncbi:hypothetical protein ACSLPA_33225, partial [Escherichia coli]
DNPAVQLLMVGEDSDYDEEDDQVFKNKISINDLWITAQDIRRGKNGVLHVASTVSKFVEASLQPLTLDRNTVVSIEAY